jgi:hypothetical protein
MVLPLMSVMVTTVLLKVERMCAMPVAMFFRTRRFCLPLPLDVAISAASR